VSATDIRDLVHFSDEGASRETLVEGEHLWSEILCLGSNQRLGPLGDAASDALCVVLAGKVAAQIGRGRNRMRQWDSIVVPAGSELTLANASEEPSVVLLVVAPPPEPANR
jgi:hypothetical protein